MERKLFRKSMSKNVPVMFAIFFLYFMISDSIDIVIPLYFKKLDINMGLYGGLLSFTKIMRALVIIPISLWSIKKKMNCLKIWLLVDMAVMLIFLNRLPTFIVLAGLSMIIITTSVLNVILNPLLGKEAGKEHVGKVFGIRDVFLYAGCFLGLFIVGIIKGISDSTNAIWIFYFCIFTVIYVTVSYIDKKVRKKAEDRDEEETPEKQEKGKHTGVSKELVYYLAVTFILGIGAECAEYVPLVAKDIGIQENSIFFLFSTSTVITSALAIVGGMIVDKYNKKRMFQLDIVIFIIIACMYCSSNIYIFTFAVIFGGLASILNNAANSYVFVNFTDEEVDKFWGMIGSVSLVSSSIGALLGGVAYEIGNKLPFILGIAIHVLGLLLSVRMKNTEAGAK